MHDGDEGGDGAGDAPGGGRSGEDVFADGGFTAGFGGGIHHGGMAAGQEVVEVLAGAMGFLGAEDEADAWGVAEEFRAAALGHAAEVAEDCAGAVGFGLACDGAHLAEGLLFREIADAARVEQDDVGVGFGCRGSIAAGHELGEDGLAVALVHLAAVGLDENAGHSESGPDPTGRRGGKERGRSGGDSGVSKGRDATRLRAMAPESSGRGFPETRWSRVLRAQGEEGGSGEALADLCQAYWHPLYVYARRCGQSPEDAEDWRGRQSLKRGGGRSPIRFGSAEAEDVFRALASTEGTPDAVFDRVWLGRLLEGALGALEKEHAARGKERMFQRLQEFLAWERGEEGLAAVAEELGVSHGALRVTIQRMRQRFRLLLERQVAETLVPPAEAGEELQRLLHSAAG